MKQLIILMAILILASSCKEKNQQLDPNVKLSLNGVSSLSKSINTKGIGGTEITDSLEFIVKYAWWFNTPLVEQGSGFGFRERYAAMRDFEKKKLLFWGINVISSDGKLGNFVMNFDDIVLVTGLDKNGNAINPKDEFDNITFGEPLDTIGYIPNSVIRVTRAAVVEAFNAGDYATCYSLFDNAYVFIPTTGAKWRAMKAAGKN